MTMDLYPLLRDLGFPAFVAAVVLLRLEPAIREQTKVVRDLKDILLSLNGHSPIGEELRKRELEKQRAKLQVLEG